MADTIRLLILDDDADFARTLADLLPARFQSKTAYSIRQAAEQLAAYPFDWIVSDFVLAEHNGFDFLKTLSSLAQSPKVIFITAFANKEMAISLLNQYQCDCNAYS